MKTVILRIAVIALALAAAISCKKQEEHPSYERTARIASYYGGVSGEGVFKVLNACVDGRWEHWPGIKGLDYEEGYEYEVRVRFDYNHELDGMMDVMFPYSATLVELVGKTQRTTDDCPLPTYDEFLENLMSQYYPPPRHTPPSRRGRSGKAGQGGTGQAGVERGRRGGTGP